MALGLKKEAEVRALAERLDVAAAAPTCEVRLSPRQAIRLFGVVASVAGGVAACSFLGGFLADRREDRQAQRLAPELRVRQLRMRRWRQGLSRRARKDWAATGLLGSSVRQLVPSAYSQQLERELLAANPGGKC